MPFARFEDWDSCINEMTGLGHSPESAKNICGSIKERAEKGLLYKAESTGLEILSKADSEDLYVGGNASWDIKDDEGDVITVSATAKGAQRFFNLPPQYRNITFNHKEFNLAEPVLSYTKADGETVYTHVHEKGWYLISKIRNDNLTYTKALREEVKKGNINGYSITGKALEHDPNNPQTITDIEFHTVTLTQKGVMKPINPMSRNVKLLKSSKEKCDCDTDKCGGACCTFMTQQIPREDADVKAYLDLHGLEYKSDRRGGLYVKFPVQCKAFDAETKLCKAHDNRPNVCKIYPVQESPFIEKAKCSLLQQRMAELKRKGADMAVINENGQFIPMPDAKMQIPKGLENEELISAVEDILRKHGFNKP